MNSPRHQDWPALPYEGWKDTCTTLHLWAQIVGKVRLAQTPWVNHSWHATLYPTVRGLTTSTFPYEDRALQIDFDFLSQYLQVRVSDGGEVRLPLVPQTVASFHRRLHVGLQDLGTPVEAHGSPNEVEDPIPFAEDEVHSTYDGEAARRFWRVLLQIQRVFERFRTAFLGKVSPVHLFWGSFDLAVTRFSGRTAPVHPGGIPHLPDEVTREAYSHEVSSAGFWPGGGPYDDAAFYAYAYPTPDAFPGSPVGPDAAFYLQDAGEFLLPYEAVRTAADPEAALMEFLQTTYVAAAETLDWPRDELEIPLGIPGEPREIT